MPRVQVYTIKICSCVRLNSVTFIVVEFKIVEVKFLYIPKQVNI